MSSEKLGGAWSFQCDSCPEAVTTNQSDFKEALAEAKAEGFVAFNHGGLWFHACASCKRDDE
jgi:hypothetical protein